MLWLIWASLAGAGPLEDGVAALKGGRAADARLLLTEAVEADPGAVQGWWELGWACWVLEDFERASSSWAKVQALDPTKEDVGFWLGAATTRASLRASLSTRPPVEVQPNGPGLRFVAAGDTMMGSDLRRGERGLPPGDGASSFDAVRALLSAGDLTFLNLEGPLADGLPSGKCGPDSSSCYAFRTPTRYAAALKGAGVDVVSLANNHAFDLGPAGQQSTMDALDAVGVAHAGRYGDVAVLEVSGQRVAVVAAHSGACCLNVNHLDEVRAAVQLADAQADLVVFSFHGGAEGSGARHVPGRTEVAWGEKRGDVKALAHAAIDAGADVVVGHGPHVLRAMEVYRGRLIAYSMGNFMGYKQFGTKGGYGGHTAILDLQLAQNGALIAGRVHSVILDGSSVPHLDPENTGGGYVTELSKADFPDTGVSVDPEGRMSWPGVLDR